MRRAETEDMGQGSFPDERGRGVRGRLKPGKDVHSDGWTDGALSSQNMMVLTTRLGYGIPLKDGDEKTDEEAERPYSDDEMLTHKGLRRSQSMKSVKTVKGRKEVSQVQSCLPNDSF